MITHPADDLRREADLRIAAARRLLSATLLEPGWADPFVVAAADLLLDQAQRLLTAAGVDHWAVAA